ncbi:hypothetical protein BFP77_08350 [Maribacter sp. 4U21]|nr:hypothetical protein BFP77_08350 [Maribacter sp. 4U21]
MSSKLSKIGAKGRSTFVKVNQQVENMTVNIHKADRASKRLTSTWGGLLGMASRLGLAFSVGQTVRGIINLGAESESTRISFETMLGSAQKADSLIQQINRFANATPYNNRDLQKNTETLLGFGVAHERVLPILSMLGDVSRGNKERLNSMTLAYSQMSSAGRLMGQDLNQMINAGFNPLKFIAEATGESIAQVKKRMEEGAVSAGEVERAFARATSKGGPFYNMMEKLSKSFSGRFSTFMGKLQQFGMQLGLKLLPYLSKFLEWGITAIDYLPILTSYVGDLFTWVKDSWIFGLLADNIGLVVGGLVAWKTASFALAMGLKIQSLWTTLLTIKQWSLNAAMAANPIGFVLLGIMALAAAFTYAYNQLGWFRGAVDASWALLKGFGTAIKNFVTDRVIQLIEGVKGLGTTFLHFWNGDFKKGIASGGEALKNLTGIGKGSLENFKKDAAAAGMASATAFGKGMAQAAKNKKKGFLASMLEGTGLEKLVNPSSPSSTTDGATGDGGGTGLGDAVTNGINAINGGGARQTNITVTFDKLVENFTISSQNISQGMAQSEEELKRMLLRVLNSTNQMQTSPV